MGAFNMTSIFYNKKLDVFQKNSAPGQLNQLNSYGRKSNVFLVWVLFFVISKTIVHSFCFRSEPRKMPVYNRNFFLRVFVVF